jgi:hypothetical protein
MKLDMSLKEAKEDAVLRKKANELNHHNSVEEVKQLRDHLRHFLREKQ